MNKTKTAISALFLMLLLSFASTVTAQTLTVSGSDLLSEMLKPALTSYAEERDITLSLNLEGSTPAMSKIRNGATDIAFLANPDNSPIEIQDYETMPFAYIATVVIVHIDNPIPEISIKQLASIYGEDITPNISRWNELSVSGILGSRNIQATTASGKHSIALEPFKYNSMPEHSIKANVVSIEDPLEIIQKINTGKNSIALIPKFEDKYEVKILAVSGNETAEGKSYAFHPTDKNISFGDYPLRLNFNLLIKKSEKKKYSDLLKILFGNDMADKLKEHYLVPLPERNRKRLILGLDIDP